MSRSRPNPVRRHDTLKVIKLGMDTKQVVARFEAEIDSHLVTVLAGQRVAASSTKVVGLHITSAP